MRETSRLKNPSLADCMNSGYQYGLRVPYTRTESHGGNSEAGDS